MTYTLLPTPHSWKTPVRLRHLRKIGWGGPDYALARVTNGPNWDELDTALRDIASPVEWDLQTYFAIVPQAAVPLLAEHFARHGVSNRLLLRELPTV
ncbi:hypothetical protein [Streptomyces triculaminicus]|uniref:hypothetical protein n=1 Tax=Streptomyces triculaminicus TaxID=2816232 RepID=UPI0037AD8B73